MQIDTVPETAGQASAQSSQVDAFVETFPDSKNPIVGPLSDLTFGVKEVMEQAGRRTPLGLDILRDRVGQCDAAVITQAEQAGATRIATTRSTALAIAGEARTRNPRDLRLSPGGSSAGSAAAIAVGALDFAFSTQTVGSIVRPASYCGVPGFKPTFDALSTQGVMPLSRDLDHVGIIARDLDTIGLVFSTLAGGADSQKSFRSVVIPKLWFAREPHPAASKACDIANVHLGEMGLATSDIVLSGKVIRNEDAVLNQLLCRGIFDHHRALIEANVREIPYELSEKMKLGAAVSDDALASLRAAQDDMRKDMDVVVPDDAAVMMPSVIDLPPRLGHGTGLREPQRLFTLLGWPVVSLPICSYGGHYKHLTISIQLASKPGTDLALISLAREIEKRVLSSNN